MIIPIGNTIQIKIDEVKAGALDLSMKETAIEYGEVLAIGKDVRLDIKVGDKIFFKSWAIDIISYEGERFYFINPETNGLLAIIK